MGRLDRGRRDGVIHEPRGAVLLSAEDDLARTIRPRLDAAGAELDRVAVVALRERDGSTRDPVISAADLRAVEVAIREVDAVLLVVDPLVAYLPDEVNANLPVIFPCCRRGRGQPVRGERRDDADHCRNRAR
jgi:hypothetical protein